MFSVQVVYEKEDEINVERLRVEPSLFDLNMIAICCPLGENSERKMISPEDICVQTNESKRYWAAGVGSSAVAAR